MWAGSRRRQRPGRERGVAAVEFALLALFFFTLVFGIIEVARLLYVFGTVQEVTRRGADEASHIYPRDAEALALVRQHAVLRESPGDLALAPPATDASIRIDYLALLRDADDTLHQVPVSEADWPVDAAANRALCMADPNAPHCIRYVRVRLCDPDDTSACVPLRSRMLLPLIDLRVPLPVATTVVPAESLGFRPGMAPPDVLRP